MTLLRHPNGARRKAVWGPKRTLVALLLLVAGFSPNAFGQSSRARQYKLDDEVTRRKDANPAGTTSVIVTMVPGAQLPAQFKKFVRGGNLEIISGVVLELPNGHIRQLESRPEIFRVHFNRPSGNLNYRTSVTVGATAVRHTLGYQGAGIGIAVIDSGIASWHDDMSGATSSGSNPYGDQRVRMFVDFVNGQAQPYDDSGHGSHVSGVIAGNGYDSNGNKAGIAPQASIISLKVLDANGRGTIGNMIAAMNWIAANHQGHNIKVVNMSVGARITESYLTDPLTLAAKALVDRNIVVVGAAGNFGKNANGSLQYGGITAPSNAPWVLTVGASSTMGTLTRNDDTMAGYSSSGPTFIDFDVKPDLVAPGTGTVSLSSPGSTFYANKPQYLVDGKPVLGHKPYLTLSGTSMAAPVVSGSVALMLEANPSLTPNLVKAILQYTAQQYPGYNALRQGAGFLNTLGAVRLARFYANNEVGSRMPVQRVWSKQVLWGNYRITGGFINPRASAWRTTTTWGAIRAMNGDNIIWGTDCGTDCDNIIWGTNDADGDNVIWGTSDADSDNVIWGTECTDANCDNIIWGTADDDNVIWGTDCGGADCDNVIWGTDDDGDNIIWGTAEAGANVMWATSRDPNVVWATSADADVTWGNAAVEALSYADDAETQPVPDPALEFGDTAPAPTTTTGSSTDSSTTSTSTTSAGV